MDRSNITEHSKVMRFSWLARGILIVAMLGGTACQRGDSPAANDAMQRNGEPHQGADRYEGDERQMDARGQDDADPLMNGDIDPAQMCPAAVEGVQVDVEDVEQGAALVYSASGAQRAEVQRLTQLQATYLQQHADRMAQQSQRPGTPSEDPQAPQLFEGISDLQARSMTTGEGARLELTTSEAAEVEMLRLRTREYAQVLREQRSCPIMERALQ